MLYTMDTEIRKGDVVVVDGQPAMWAGQWTVVRVNKTTAQIRQGNTVERAPLFTLAKVGEGRG